MTTDSAIRGAGVRLTTGPEVLRDLGGALDDLHAATGAPVTARRPWLQTWLECHPDWQPWAFALPVDGDRLDGAALLACRRRRPFAEVVALGHGPSDQARLPARTAEAAAALAAGVAEHLRGLPFAWRLRLRELPVGDPVARGIAERLRHVEMVDAEPSPTVRFGHDRSPAAYTSGNTHKSNRRMRNRIARAGLSYAVEYLRDLDRIRAALPDVERVHRDRDAQNGWSYGLDDPGFGCFFRSLILGFADRGEVELTTLRLGGELAAYVVAFPDGDAYRMWGTRVSPAWADYGAGRLVVSDTIGRALALGCAEYDYMRGVDRYKLSNATDIVPAQNLHAWSSPLVRLPETPARVRGRASEFKRRHPSVERGWATVRRFRAALPRPIGR